MGYTISGDATFISIHAPTKGATLLICIMQISTNNFNPRSHEGSDVSFLTISLIVFISIHAPTKGATSSSYPTVMVLEFQSTLPRRERPCAHVSRDILVNFNPRSHEGSDDNCHSSKYGHKRISIHAPTKGATCQ